MKQERCSEKKDGVDCGTVNLKNRLDSVRLLKEAQVNEIVRDQ